MDKFNQLPLVARAGIMIAVGAVILAAAWYGPYPGLADERSKNDAAQQKLAALKTENDKLRPYEGQLKQIDLTIASLERQMDRQKQIVPDGKDADQFIRDLQATALASGVEIRSYVAKPIVAKQYYSEVPFDLEIDGPYFAVLNFFEKVGALERIVNVENLRMAGIGSKATSPVKHRYDYTPSETVAVACTAKTFFSQGTGQPGAPGKPGVPGAAAPRPSGGNAGPVS